MGMAGIPPKPASADTTLRPYQQEAKRDVWEAWHACRRVLLQMPTGAGKTRLFVSLIRDIRMQRKTARVLIVTHRTELVEQISSSLATHYGLKHAILKNSAGQTWAEDVVVASIQMLDRRLKAAAGRTGGAPPAASGTFDYIIVDEAHHSLAPAYAALWEAYPRARFLGVTATPYRLRKASFEGLYDRLLVSYPAERLISEGWLAGYEVWTVSSGRASIRAVNRLKTFGADGEYRPKDLRELVETDGEISFLYECYRTYAAGKRGIVYAVNREHAGRIAAAFKAQGLKAAAVDFRTPKGERRQVIEAFREGRGVDILVNVELFTEGFDCPSIEFVMLARPTRSLVVYLQQVGRSLRPSPDGSPVAILDCVGLYHRFGRPDRRRDWESHFRGLGVPREDYAKRPLGEADTFPGMRRMERPERSAPKPLYEVRPSGTDIHVFRLLDGSNACGLMGRDGKVICEAGYDELGCTPFGWYVGVKRVDFFRYTDIIDLRHGKTYRFNTLRKIDDLTYEAERSSVDRGTTRVRFSGMLRLLPLQTMRVNGIDIYLVSDVHGRKQYSLSLRLDAPLFLSYEPYGEACVVLNRRVRNAEAFIADGSSLKPYEE